MGSGVPRLAIVPDLLYVTCPMITFQLLNIEGYHFIKGLMDDSSRFPIEWWGVPVENNRHNRAGLLSRI